MNPEETMHLTNAWACILGTPIIVLMAIVLSFYWSAKVKIDKPFNALESLIENPFLNDCMDLHSQVNFDFLKRQMLEMTGTVSNLSFWLGGCVIGGPVLFCLTVFMGFVVVK